MPAELLSEEEEVYIYKVGFYSATNSSKSLLRLFSQNTQYYSTLLFSSMSDPGDGGLQGDRWTHRPAALCCDLQSGTENSHHGVSEAVETHSSIKAGPDLP